MDRSYLFCAAFDASDCQARISHFLEPNNEEASKRSQSQNLPVCCYSTFSALAFDQRAWTAFRAISLRRSGLSFAARSFPPLDPPILPRATACGFFWNFLFPFLLPIMDVAPHLKLVRKAKEKKS
jgi:hypothetical protein